MFIICFIKIALFDTHVMFCAGVLNKHSFIHALKTISRTLDFHQVCQEPSINNHKRTHLCAITHTSYSHVIKVEGIFTSGFCVFDFTAHDRLILSIRAQSVGHWALFHDGLILLY